MHGTSSYPSVLAVVVVNPGTDTGRATASVIAKHFKSELGKNLRLEKIPLARHIVLTHESFTVVGVVMAGV